MDITAVNNFGDTRDGGLAGPMGLFLVVLMCIATVLLIRNMNKRIRRLPDSFSAKTERERVAEIARLDSDLERSAGDTSPGVDAGRSAGSAGVEDAEVEAVPEGKREPASDSGKTAP